jgi:hypothetical protein
MKNRLVVSLQSLRKDLAAVQQRSRLPVKQRMQELEEILYRILMELDELIAEKEE